MVCKGISGGGWSPVKLSIVESKNGQTTYKTSDGVTICAKSGQKLNVTQNKEGQYRFDGVNNAVIFGSNKKDKFLFTNSKNNTINVRNDSHGGDQVILGSETKGNTIVGDKYDITKDNQSRYANHQLHQSVFTYRQNNK